MNHESSASLIPSQERLYSQIKLYFYQPCRSFFINASHINFLVSTFPIFIFHLSYFAVSTTNHTERNAFKIFLDMPIIFLQGSSRNTRYQSERRFARNNGHQKVSWSPQLLNSNERTFPNSTRLILYLCTKSENESKTGINF